jgi:hypothetical protein
VSGILAGILFGDSRELTALSAEFIASVARSTTVNSDSGGLTTLAVETDSVAEELTGDSVAQAKLTGCAIAITNTTAKSHIKDPRPSKNPFLEPWRQIMCQDLCQVMRQVLGQLFAGRLCQPII